jgi:hypothetical protein
MRDHDDGTLTVINCAYEAIVRLERVRNILNIAAPNNELIKDALPKCKEMLEDIDDGWFGRFTFGVLIKMPEILS